jgi:triacylglycerol lipase
MSPWWIVIIVFGLFAVLLLLVWWQLRPHRLDQPFPPVKPEDTSDVEIGTENADHAKLSDIATDIAAKASRDSGALPVVITAPTVILVHGFWGYNRIGLPRVGLHYFRGICQHLAANGITALTVRLPPGGGVPERAGKLATLLRSVPGRIVIIGHSMGGLDARYLAAKSDLVDRIAAVITVGTPHRGTPLADVAAHHSMRLIYRMVQALGIPIDAVQWLTTEGAARFNAEIKDNPRIFYGSVVAGKRLPTTPISVPLRIMHKYLNKFGPNDGVVPLDSQPWGTVLADIEADHLAQTGWGAKVQGFSASDLYLQLVQSAFTKECEAQIPTRKA